ncbi:group II intron reverse transcriptase/maturase [Streptomyces globisporus]|uniref:group II intron reverse transcriptase/maturase n=1 Tax=Streptomyces globisporus TaxID=1908 RepID=UPI002D21E0E4|nr:group II intron reverse transcriptase/maturase [Streptomyces globisporus]
MSMTARLSPDSANGPSDVIGKPPRSDWAKAEKIVRRLRQRIFRAAQEGDLKKVRNLQKLMLRSHSNLVVSVRRVTQKSKGKKTAGVDGEIALTPSERKRLIKELASETGLAAKPVKRVYIPKSNGKMRPLGIPVIRDRVHQARAKNALEPEWEARFEARSYGFRPGRSCHDAISTIHTVTSGRRTKRLWVLDADLAAAFDRINHERLLEAIDLFPGREMIGRWLRAGVMENRKRVETNEGTPQGGVISPLLLNIALHGMTEAAGATERVIRTNPNAPALIRYADDFVALCATKEEALMVKERLAEWLEPKGLAFNEEKTRVVHLSEGFDFLGFNIQRMRNGKVIIRPSRDAVKRLIRVLKDRIRSMDSWETGALVGKLNPIIRGWATYYRGVVSSNVFATLDSYVFQRLWLWAMRRHRNKDRLWRIAHYWGEFNIHRRDRWVFGDRKTGAYLIKFSWTKIVRHKLVKGRASKDDPGLAAYWASRSRSRKHPDADGKRNIGLAVRQKGLCPKCGLDLIEGAEFEPQDVREWVQWFSASAKRLHVHHIVYRRDGGSDNRSNLELIHADCHRELHTRGDRRTPIARASQPA